jgi:nitroreductase
MQDMDVFEAVRTVLAVRKYQDRPIPDETVHQIVEAGRLTGSSRNLQPWQFVVVQDKEMLRQLGALVQTGQYTAQAALAIVVLIEKESEFAVSDGSRAIQSMVLTAWDAGIGSNWAGFANRHQDVKTFLGVPAEFDILAILPFGYPVDAVGQGKKQRKALGEVAHRDRFGQPFE